MVQLFAFRRSLRVVALALCSAAIRRIGHSGFGKVSSWRRTPRPCALSRRHHRQAALSPIVATGISRDGRAGSAAWRRCGRSGFANAHASVAPDAIRQHGDRPAVSARPTWSAEARRYIGGNPTGRGSLWCARFMNMVLQRTGHHGTGSDMASSFASYGQRVSGPQVGAIAVMGRRGGGHVGIITASTPRQSDHDLRQ